MFYDWFDGPSCEAPNKDRVLLASLALEMHFLPQRICPGKIYYIIPISKM